MANQKQGPTRPCRIFLCYRRETAQTAITFKGIMDRDSSRKYGNIWYSNLEGVGNFILDIPELIEEAEWIVFFVGKAFTAGFLDENEINQDCVTAQELIAIEKERQKRKREGKPFHLMTVNVDGGCFDRQCAKDIKQLFLVAGILKDDSVAAYRGLNQNPYHSISTLPHDFIEEHVAPYCAFPAAPAEELTPMPKKKETPEPPAAEKKPEPVLEKKTEPALDMEAVEADSPAAHEQAVTVTESTGLKLLDNGNVLFGSYPQTAEGERQPIEWLVLKREKDRALLISKYALDAKPYNDKYIETTWAECSLHHWLNGRRKEDFPQVAFTVEEREQILLTQVTTEKNPYFRTEPELVTEDKVFLLSIPEASVLFSPDKARRCTPTDYAKNQGAYTVKKFKAEDKPACWWWLRSPGCSSSDVACVYSDGSISLKGCRLKNYDMGVRPALWVKL